MRELLALNGGDLRASRRQRRAGRPRRASRSRRPADAGCTSSSTRSAFGTAARRPPVLDRLSLFVRSGEIAAVVGPAGAGKTTLLRYMEGGRTGRAVYLSVRKLTRASASRAWSAAGGSRGETTHSHPSGARSDGAASGPGATRSRTWRWTAPAVRPRVAGPRKPTTCISSIHSRDGTVREVGWEGAGPNDPNREDLVLVDDLSTRLRFGDAADQRALIRDLHVLHPRPHRRSVICATSNPADALEVSNRIAVFRRGRIVQCGTPSEVPRAPASRFVARLFQQ